MSHQTMSRRTAAALAACVLALASTPLRAADPPRRVVLVGATAKSAPAFFQRAFALGYEVTGIARHPEAVTVKDPRLTVVRGDVYDERSIEAALTGKEVVVSYLSCCRTADVPHGETAAEIDLYSRGIGNVIAAMKAKGNRRLIAVSSTSVEHVVLDRPADDAPQVDRMMWNGRHRFDDQRRMEALIAESGLEYVIVRPARVTGDVSPGTPLYIVVNRGSYDPYHRQLSRPDLAAFVLAQVEGTAYLGTVVGVWN